MNLRLLLFSFLLLQAFIAFGQLRLAPIFTDNMVLQQASKPMVWGWAAPGETVRITSGWNGRSYSTKAAADGKWKVVIETVTAGGPYELTIAGRTTIRLKNVMLGEVWLCAGQSNMEMPVKGFKGQPVLGSNETILKSANNNIRLYTVPRGSRTTLQDTTKHADWKVAGPEAVGNFSATAYFFGKNLQQLLHVPIGLINVSYGGSQAESWMDAETLQAFADIKVPAATDSIKSPNRTPTTLYNAMLHPVIGYGIKGITWYQGESNYERPDQYEKLFPAMVAQWRRQWGLGDVPFYYVQIAPYDYTLLPPYQSGGKYNSAYLRDAQRKALHTIPNSGMAVVIDIGEEKNIHPAAKKQGGERLALLALAKTYGLKGFGYESPVYDSLIIADGIAEVRFRGAENWLTSYGKELYQFEIAGKDKIFYPAKAVINRSSVMVSSPQVRAPVAVRYAFKDFVVGDLFSTEGLPASSFRTDDW